MINLISGAFHQAARRRRQLAHLWKVEGYKGIASRARKAAAAQLKPRTVAWEVDPHDVALADLSNSFVPSSRKIPEGESIRVNWVTSPAHPGSGGHTTIYRMIKYLERNGFENHLYFYNKDHADIRYYAEIARKNYGVACPISDLADGMLDADAVMATSWASAYAVYNARGAGKRFYFVQDYEPYFYPIGANSLLAENTYRMGFHAITAGPWLAQKLAEEFDAVSDHFPLGCDTSLYRLSPHSTRSGVAFYTRAETPRRGSELGLLALQIFAKRNPQVELHFYGEPVGELPFRFIDHGVVSPAKLNEIYNRCYAGLCLSLTNASLVPYEMLAAGCIPVVNDAAHNRMVLDNSHVRYAQATPHALARAIEEVIGEPDFATMSQRAAESVVATTWDDAGAEVEAALRRSLRSENKESIVGSDQLF